MDVAGRALITLPIAFGVVLLIALLFGLASGRLVARRIDRRSYGRPRHIARIHRAFVACARFHRSSAAGHVLASAAGVDASRRLRVGDVVAACFWRRSAAVPKSVSCAPLSGCLPWSIGAIIGLVAPGGIIFFLFPPLLASDRDGRRALVAPRPSASARLPQSSCFYLTWGAYAGAAQELLNGGPMWIFAPLGAFLILPILIEAKPWIDGVQLRSSAAIAGTVAFLGWAAAAAAPAYSADRQQRFVIEHVTDLPSGKSAWSVINDGAPLPRPVPHDRQMESREASVQRPAALGRRGAGGPGRPGARRSTDLPGAKRKRAQLGVAADRQRQ